jgi:hypothetical protein
MSDRWGDRRTGWSVRARILTTILAIAALGLIAAGGTAFLVGRQTVLVGIDERLTEQVASARLVALGEGSSGARFDTTADALEAIVAQVAPDRNSGSLGILDGRPAYVPGVTSALDVPTYPAIIDRILGEVADGSVRLGTMSTPRAICGTWRHPSPSTPIVASSSWRWMSGPSWVISSPPPGPTSPSPRASSP